MEDIYPVVSEKNEFEHPILSKLMKNFILTCLSVIYHMQQNQMCLKRRFLYKFETFDCDADEETQTRF